MSKLNFEFPGWILLQWKERLGRNLKFCVRFKKKGIICPWVFNRAGKPIKEFRRTWKSACNAAGVPGRIPHDFRRTAVRNLVRAGIPERVAMQLTGHKTRSVFERYNIVSEGDLFAAANKLDKMADKVSDKVSIVAPKMSKVSSAKPSPNDIVTSCAPVAQGIRPVNPCRVFIPPTSANKKIV
jgi:hypothetical protein